jgi:fibro-slime domain-containing protein
MYVGGGHKVLSQWRNAQGQPIHPSLYNATLGDSAGSLASATDSGGIVSAESYRQWYRDTPGVNMSSPYTLTLTRSGGTDDVPIYTYQSNSFFPLDGQLYGNSGGSPDHNFHFTLELHTTFTYSEDANPVFSFYGDDDVWVYINGQLVIDIGGVHSQVQQVVELNRLGLEDGEDYTLDFFFAERHRTQSNFRIDTTLLLESADTPSVSAAYD